MSEPTITIRLEGGSGGDRSAASGGGSPSSSQGSGGPVSGLFQQAAAPTASAQIFQNLFTQLLAPNVGGGQALWGQIGRAVGNRIAQSEAVAAKAAKDKFAHLYAQQTPDPVADFSNVMGGVWKPQFQPDVLHEEPTQEELMKASMGVQGWGMAKLSEPNGFMDKVGHLAGAMGPAAPAIAAIANAGFAVRKGMSDISDGANIASSMVQFAQGPLLGPILGSVIDKVTGMVGDLMRSPGVIASRVGSITSMAAQGENAAAIGATYDAFTDLAGQIPIVGRALDIMGDSAGQVARAFNSTVMAFVDRGRQLSGYSGELAVSYALGDVKQLLADIDEANEMDGPLARLNNQQNELSLMLRDLLLPIKKFVAEILGDLLQGGVDAAKDLKPILEIIRDVVIAGIKAHLDLLAALYEGQKLFTDPLNLKKVIRDAILGAEEEKKAARATGVTWDDMVDDLGPNRGLQRQNGARLRDIPILKQFGRGGR